MEKRNVLILGAKGMLGQELVREFLSRENYQVTGWDYEDIDVTDSVAAKERILALAPTLIVNAVAYNAVDLCEEDEEEYRKAMRLNAEVPGFLARVARDLDATFVHYSTDYVFDGSREGGYAEFSEPDPISKYGESKLVGERNVEQVFAKGEEKGEMGVREGRGIMSGKYYIVRLSKLFGKPASSVTAKKSFFETMLRLGKEQSEVRVVDGEMSCFTYAPDLARATRELLESGDESGIYHLTNDGAVTWYESVLELYRQAGLETKVVPITSEELKRPAKRPACSILLNTKRPKLRLYTEALEEFLKAKE